MSATTSVTIIRTSGAVERHAIATAILFREIERLIDAQTLDAVNLRDGRTMFVDDHGYEVEGIEHPPSDGFAARYEFRPVRARKPLNATATALYHRVCYPGVRHAIVGDVAIVTDLD